MRFSKLISIVMIFFFIISSACRAEIKTITFGVDATYPPFEFLAPDGSVQGFEVEIVKKLCKQINAQCKFVNLPFDSLIPSLKLGKVDAAFSCISYNDERAQQVKYVKPYMYIDTVSFIALKNQGDLTDDNLIKTKIIAIEGGTIYKDYLQKKYGDSIKIKTYEDAQQEFMDLIAGRVDIVMGDTPFISQWLKNQANQDNYQINVIHDPAFENGSYLIVRKDNAELAKTLSSAIQAAINNGVIPAIVKPYLK